MADYRVTAIVKRQHNNPHERIQALCGPNWGPTIEETIIREINLRLNTYHVVVAGARRVEVIVRVKNGREYLTTPPDGEIPNNLLSLPDCR